MRRRALLRILKVQEDLRRASEARLVALRRRESELQGMEHRILDAMTGGDPRDSALAHMSGDRLRWLDRDLKENASAREACETRLRELLAQKLACERAELQARREDEAEAMRKALESMIESHYAQGASFE